MVAMASHWTKHFPLFLQNYFTWRSQTCQRCYSMGFEAMLLLFGDIWFIWFGLWCLTLYYYISCNVEPRSWRDVLNTTLCDKVCQRLATGRWFSPGTAVSSTNKTNHHNITEILLRVALNTINQAIFYQIASRTHPWQVLSWTLIEFIPSKSI